MEDSTSKFGNCDNFFSPQILETQDSLEEPEEEGDNIMLVRCLILDLYDIKTISNSKLVYVSTHCAAEKKSNKICVVVMGFIETINSSTIINQQPTNYSQLKINNCQWTINNHHQHSTINCQQFTIGNEQSTINNE